MAPLTYAELVEVARIEWEKQPAAFRERAAEFLEGLAAKNGGEIGLEELMRSGLVNGMGKKEFVARIFGALDEDRKGRLSIDRCIAVYYMCLHSSRRICRSCANPILPGLAFSCLTCAAPNSSSSSFALCLPCYSSNRPGSSVLSHPHPLFHDYVAFDQLLRRPPQPAPPPPGGAAAVTTAFPPPVRVPPDPAQTMKQCVVCGDFHELEAAGLMVGYHMTKLKGSANDYVCEWCFAYFCSMCGRRFRDSTTNAEPAKWLQQFLCGNCSESRGATADGYGRMIMNLNAELKTSEVLRQCRTCSIKHRNGTLFWTVDVRSQLAKPRPTPMAPPPRHPPSPFIRPAPNVRPTPRPAAAAPFSRPSPQFSPASTLRPRPPAGFMHPDRGAPLGPRTAAPSPPSVAPSMEVRPWHGSDGSRSDSGDVGGSVFDRDDRGIDVRSRSSSGGGFKLDGSSVSNSDSDNESSSSRLGRGRAAAGPPAASDIPAFANPSSPSAGRGLFPAGRGRFAGRATRDGRGLPTSQGDIGRQMPMGRGYDGGGGGGRGDGASGGDAENSGRWSSSSSESGAYFGAGGTADDGSASSGSGLDGGGEGGSYYSGRGGRGRGGYNGGRRGGRMGAGNYGGAGRGVGEGGGGPDYGGIDGGGGGGGRGGGGPDYGAYNPGAGGVGPGGPDYGGYNPGIGGVGAGGPDYGGYNPGGGGGPGGPVYGGYNPGIGGGPGYDYPYGGNNNAGGGDINVLVLPIDQTNIFGSGFVDNSLNYGGGGGGGGDINIVNMSIQENDYYGGGGGGGDIDIVNMSIQENNYYGDPAAGGGGDIDIGNLTINEENNFYGGDTSGDVYIPNDYGGDAGGGFDLGDGGDCDDL